MMNFWLNARVTHLKNSLQHRWDLPLKVQFEVKRTDIERVHIPRWKRMLDVTCILISSPAWLPLMIAISLWIKMISRGPVLFRQERIGYRGRRFSCLKFRSMKVNAETQSHEGYFEKLIKSESPMIKLDNRGDSRLIPWGKLFRATGLDELPQILNVLRGEMSLVGPRPCTPHEFQHYEPWQRERFNAPAGLTGYWQVNGKNKTTFREMMEMDIFYGKNMSLRLDIAIILKTPPALAIQVWESLARKQMTGRESQGELAR